MLNWMEVRKWAKEKGYTSFREKVEGTDNRYDYYWAKENDPSVTGLSTSAGRLATDIFNHITDNKFLDYQAAYELNKEDPTFSLSDYGK